MPPTYDIFLLYDGAEAVCINRDRTLNFHYRSSPRLATCGTILSRDAGQRQRTSAASQPCDHKDK